MRLLLCQLLKLLFLLLKSLLCPYLKFWLRLRLFLGWCLRWQLILQWTFLLVCLPLSLHSFSFDFCQILITTHFPLIILGLFFDGCIFINRIIPICVPLLIGRHLLWLYSPFKIPALKMKILILALLVYDIVGHTLFKRENIKVTIKLAIFMIVKETIKMVKTNGMMIFSNQFQPSSN